MKPSGEKSMPPNLMTFANFALLSELKPGDVVVLRDALFPYVGAPAHGTRTDLIWGVYGTSSINHLSYLAYAEAARLNKQMINVLGWYLLPELSSIPNRIDAAAVAQHRFLHIDRAASGYRKDLLPLWRQWAKEAMPAQAAHIEQLGYRDLPVQYPSVAIRMIDEGILDAIVHPVVSLWRKADAPVETEFVTTYWVLTTRKDMQRLRPLEVRFGPPDVTAVFERGEAPGAIA